MKLRRSLLLSLFLLAGCHGDPAGPRSVAALAGRGAPPDLTRPFSLLAWTRTGGRTDPLSVASQLASSAGGDWMAVAPKPLDPVRWQPGFARGRSSGAFIIGGSGVVVRRLKEADTSVQGSLRAIRESGTPLAWQERNGRMLVYFGSDDDLAHARVHPPDSVSGLLLRARTAAGLLAMVADLWRIRIAADPAFLHRRDALLASRLPADPQRAPSLGLARGYGIFMTGISERTEPEPSPAHLFRLDGKATRDEVLSRLAHYLGGECRPTGDGWEIVPFRDAKAAQEEIDRLKEVIEDNSGREMAYPFTDPTTGETSVVIGEPRDEAQKALDSLAVLGPPAVPALAGYLSVEHASLAGPASRDLLAMDLPEARGAVTAFLDRLTTAPAGQNSAAAGAVIGQVATALARDRDSDLKLAAARALLQGKLPPAAQQEVRLALIGTGRADLLAPTAEDRLRSPDPLRFDLAVLPDGKRPPGPAAGRITPLAVGGAPGGDRWAVFLSPLLGNPRDLWLAHGRGSGWQEYLFTGRAFPQDPDGYYGRGPSLPGPGCLSLHVSGDTVTLKPPEDAEQAFTGSATLQKAMSDPKLPAAQRQAAARRMNAIMSRLLNRLRHVFTLKLSDLRRDSDGDGLPDLVEERLGTDPHKADTDGDDLPDGRDSNPLCPHKPPGRTSPLLQAVFSALFAGDTGQVPIFVILDKDKQQEFFGARAPVICVTRDEYLKPAFSMPSARVLQFGGPADAASTILRMDGPCGFNDTGSRAEVHFWEWKSNPIAGRGMPWIFMMGGSGLPLDYVATFSRDGGVWRLDAVRPWKVDSVDSAVADLLRAAMENGEQ